MAGLRLFWPRGRSGLREGPPGLGGRSSRGIAPFGMFPRAGDLLLGGGSNLGGTYGSNLPAVSYMLLGSGEVGGCILWGTPGLDFLAPWIGRGPAPAAFMADLKTPVTKGISSPVSLSSPDIARFSSGPASCSVRSPA